MRLPYITSLQTTQIDVALHLLEDVSAARTVNELVINKYFPGRQSNTVVPPSRVVDDEVFVQLVSRCPNLRSLFMKSWNFTSVRPHLLPQCSFSRLNSLSIGAMSALSVEGFFGLLSLMPALKMLSLGRVQAFDDSESSDTSDEEEDEQEDDDEEEDEDEDEEEEEALPAPACGLTHLFVLDDWNINFEHYPLLLSRSHDTLEFLELQWIFCKEIADEVVEALEHCTRLRHLTLIGNEFSNERIIAACPSVSSLALVTAPNDAELKALHAPLLTLQLENCFGDRPGKYVDSAWKQIRAGLSLMPTLREVKFNLRGKKLGRETDLRREMRQVCWERRIRLRGL